MKSYTVLFLLPLLKIATAFTPAVTVTCSVTPSYTVSLTSGSTTGVIFIDGQCAAQSTAASGSYTFDAAACTDGTVPTLGTEFTLIVQEYGTVNLSTDYIAIVTCDLTSATVVQTTFISVLGEDYDVTDGTPTVSPTFTAEFQDSNGNPITTGTVGTTAQIALSIPAAEAAVFDYQITTLVVAATDSVTMIATGCTQYSSIISQPSTPTTGALTLSFSLFIPKDTSSSPSLPGTSSTAVTFTFTIEVCDGSCTAPTCSKRRRRSADDVTNSTVEVELATSLIVFPPGHKLAERMALPETQTEGETNVCLSKTPLIGVLVALSVTLAVCMGITAWMFMRLRRPVPKSCMSEYSNRGFSVKS